MTQEPLPLLAQFGTVAVAGNDGRALDQGKMAEFQQVALSLMAQNGLRPGEPGGWRFQWDSARRRAGQCSYSTRTLSFSSGLVPHWTTGQQVQVILHEIAHALCPGHGHDSTWQLTCIKIGARPERTWGHDDEEALEPRWTGTCPNGHTTGRERQPSRDISCTRCDKRFNPSFLFTWTRNF